MKSQHRKSGGVLLLLFLVLSPLPVSASDSSTIIIGAGASIVTGKGTQSADCEDPDTANIEAGSLENNGEFDGCFNGSPTAVELVFFEGAYLQGTVLLDWLTASEIDCAGFHLWRAEEEFGEYTQITKSLIGAEGSPSQGAAYSFEDTTAEPGRAHWYKLEIFDLDGTSTFLSPVLVESPLPRFCGSSVSARGVNHFLWILLALAAMLGFAARGRQMGRIIR
jgi:hypothetical protein